MLEVYSRRRRAIPIDFRKEVRDFPRIEKARHYLHPYPAKLLAEIPFFFLANSLFSKPGETVLDPFCGTGTVLLEAVKLGRACIGADSNPLARLITCVKLSNVRTQSVLSALSRIRHVAPMLERRPFPDVVNIDYWFHPHVKEKLQQIGKAIEDMRDSSVKRYLQVCFSRCVRDVSKADPRLSVPVVLRHDQYPQRHPLAAVTRKRIARLRRINVLKRFCDITEAILPPMAQRIAKRGQASPILLRDVRDVATNLKDNSVHLVITSPPYLGAQKYIRASSLSIGWLKLCSSNKLKVLENATIGREHFSKKSCTDLPKTGIGGADRRIVQVSKLNPTRAKIACAYLCEMKHVVRILMKVLKPGGHLIFIIGNNHLCGEPFPTERYIRHLTQTEGFVVRLRMLDTIKSRGLMTKRNKTANVISRECVLVLQKPWGHGGTRERHRAERPRSIEYEFSRKAQNS
jgi:SAM-dependent methyltransferase